MQCRGLGKSLGASGLSALRMSQPVTLSTYGRNHKVGRALLSTLSSSLLARACSSRDNLLLHSAHRILRKSRSRCLGEHTSRTSGTVLRRRMDKALNLLFAYSRSLRSVLNGCNYAISSSNLRASTISCLIVDSFSQIAPRESAFLHPKAK